jgi:hypothetical protein
MSGWNMLLLSGQKVLQYVPPKHWYSTSEAAPACHNPEDHTISKFVMHITFNSSHLNILYTLNYSNSKRTSVFLLSHAEKLSIILDQITRGTGKESLCTFFTG